MVKDLNVRPETIKLLEENIGGNLHDTGLRNDFCCCCCYDTESIGNKIISEWKYIKLKSLSVAK